MPFYFRLIVWSGNTLQRFENQRVKMSVFRNLSNKWHLITETRMLILKILCYKRLCTKSFCYLCNVLPLHTIQRRTFLRIFFTKNTVNYLLVGLPRSFRDKGWEEVCGNLFNVPDQGACKDELQRPLCDEPSDKSGVRGCRETNMRLRPYFVPKGCVFWRIFRTFVHGFEYWVTFFVQFYITPCPRFTGILKAFFL